MFCQGQTVLSPKISLEESLWMLQHTPATTQQWQQILNLCTEQVLQAGLALLSLFFHPMSHNHLSEQHLQLWEEQQAGKESEEEKHSILPLSGVRFLFGKVLANLKCKEDVNQGRNVLKGCWVWVCSHDQRAHIYRGRAVVVCIRLTFKLGTGSVIALIAPGTSECSTGQINNDVCSSR